MNAIFFQMRGGISTIMYFFYFLKWAYARTKKSIP